MANHQHWLIEYAPHGDPGSVSLRITILRTSRSATIYRIEKRPAPFLPFCFLPFCFLFDFISIAYTSKGRSMPLPDSLREVLSVVGQAAVEVSCSFEGFREFVSVYRTRATAIMAFHDRFPYYSECDVVFRVVRFRVESQHIEEDRDLCNQDLIGLQEIFVPSEEAVEYVLTLWKVPMATLVDPRNTVIPV